MNKMRTILLYGLLILSILTVSVLFFFDDLRFPMLVNINASNFNKLLEVISLSYITSFIFYLVVVKLQETNNQKKIHTLLEEPVRALVDSTCMLYKNCNPNHDEVAIEIESLFKKKIPSSLENLTDFYSISNGANITQGRPQQISFIAWLKKINDGFNNDAGELVKHYGMFLDVDTISLFEELKCTDYTRLINSASIAKIGNISDLGISDKYREHHQIFIKIATQVYSGRKIYIGKKDDRLILLNTSLFDWVLNVNKIR